MSEVETPQPDQPEPETTEQTSPEPTEEGPSAHQKLFESPEDLTDEELEEFQKAGIGLSPVILSDHPRPEPSDTPEES